MFLKPYSYYEYRGDNLQHRVVSNTETQSRNSRAVALSTHARLPFNSRVIYKGIGQRLIGFCVYVTFVVRRFTTGDVFVSKSSLLAFDLKPVTTKTLIRGFTLINKQCLVTAQWIQYGYFLVPFLQTLDTSIQEFKKVNIGVYPASCMIPVPARLPLALILFYPVFKFKYHAVF